MAEEEDDPKVKLQPPDASQYSLPFVEVICKSSGKIRRFAPGTEAGFAVNLINKKLHSGGFPYALHIEAVKEGEEPISFGPNSILFSYGHGWKMQTVTEVEDLAKAERIRTPVKHDLGVMEHRLFLTEDPNSKEKKLEDVMESSEFSKGCGAVAEVRAEVDEISEQVAALKAVVHGGAKVAENDFVFLTEMLMRQLLKLDGIDAEGNGKVQRKMEVRRVQSLVETVDNLKARNLNPTGSNCNDVSDTVQSETFVSDVGSVNAQPSMPSSREVTFRVEKIDIE